MSYGTRILKMPDIPSVRVSNYKMQCFICNTAIQRGQEITQVINERKENYGIVLRTRSENPRCQEVDYYTPHTGARWVHKNCRAPSIWTKHTYKIQMDEDLGGEPNPCTQC